MFSLFIIQLIRKPQKHKFTVFVEGDVTRNTTKNGYYKAFDFELEKV
jgi:hypothetical protein